MYLQQEEKKLQHCNWDVMWSLQTAFNRFGFFSFFRDHSRKTALPKRRQLNVCNGLVSCSPCALRPRNKYFKEINFASWFIHNCIKSGIFTAGPLWGTNPTKEASRAQINEDPTDSRAPIMRKMVSLLFLESQDVGAGPSTWLCK